MSKNIVLCGIQEQGKDIIRSLYEKGIRVTHVVTISEEIAIRNKSESTWVSYEDIARELAIELYYAESYSLSTSLDINYFKDRNFYILLLGGWQRLIPKEILNTIHYPIGQHGSSEFLPEGRGRSPLNWAIILGKKRLIWNLFLLTPMMDEGDILDYDTEQREWSFTKVKKGIYNWAKVKKGTNPDNYHAYRLRDFFPQERVEIIKGDLEEYKNTRLLIIDGIGDLTTDFNDLTKSNMLIVPSYFVYG